MSLSVRLCIERWERQVFEQYRAFAQSWAIEGRQLKTRPQDPQYLEALVAILLRAVHREYVCSSRLGLLTFNEGDEIGEWDEQDGVLTDRQDSMRCQMPEELSR